MESMVLAISIVASLVVWFALRAWVNDNHPLLIELTYRLYGLRPLSRRNTYLSIRRNSFVSKDEVHRAEETVHKVVHYLAIPVVSVLPVIVGLCIHL
jgi:hypothetical protein